MFDDGCIHAGFGTVGLEAVAIDGELAIVIRTGAPEEQTDGLARSVIAIEVWKLAVRESNSPYSSGPT